MPDEEPPEAVPHKNRGVWVLLVLADLIIVATICYWLWPKKDSGPSQAGNQRQASLNLPQSPPKPAGAKGAAAKAPTPMPKQRIAQADRTIQGAPKAILCLAADAAGQIWVGTETSGIHCYRPDIDLWLPFDKSHGLGDEHVYAITCDTRGRIWAGHRSHGVSVFNGETWRNYPPAEGPLGGRVFALATCPTDGDVWIATDAGLTRYSNARDTWTHYTRAQGLPADQANSIAFDPNGNIYVGTQCDGIAMANAADDYKTWRSVSGPEAMPAVPAGEGLPTPLINQVLVARDGTVYAATTRGLARSDDAGQTWSYLRGGDWPHLVAGSYQGPPKDWNPQQSGAFWEDWILTLAEDDAGMLWLGFREGGVQRFHPGTNTVDGNADSVNAGGGIRGVVALPGGQVYYATHLGTFAASGTLYPSPVTPAKFAPPDPAALVERAGAFPSKPAPPTLEELLAASQKIRQLPPATEAAAYLGEDWDTQGDWCGHYGRQYGAVCATQMMPVFGSADLSKIEYAVGPHEPPSAVYRYTAASKTTDPRALFQPLFGTRMISERNDGSFQSQFTYTLEGPDLWIGFNLPQGPHRVSFYLMNNDSHLPGHACRDYLLELRRDPAAAPSAESIVVFQDPPGASQRETLRQVIASPLLAHARVYNYQPGVYKQFLVNGQGKWWLRIRRNHSACTKIMGIMFDQLPLKDNPHPFFNTVSYAPPAVTLPSLDAKPQSPTDAAKLLWATLDNAYAAKDAAFLQRSYRLMAYRAAASEPGNEDLLANWRWQLNLWSDADRQAFQTAAGLATTPEKN